MKKRLIAVIMVAGMMVSQLAGCGGSQTAQTAAAADTEAAGGAEAGGAAEEAVEPDAQAEAEGEIGDDVEAEAGADGAGIAGEAEAADEAEAAEQGPAGEAGDSANEEAGAGDTAKDEADVEEEENYETGDASLDDPRNQDGIGEQELLVVSFGTSFNDSRRLTIGAIESSLEEAFPDYSVRRGFTANIVIDHILRRDGIQIDDFGEALERAVNNGVRTLVIQPTHLMNGLEYNDIVAEAAQYADAFDKIVFGEPLLTSDEDFRRVAEAITAWTAEYDDGETAICFMGHGTEAESNQVYQRLQELLTEMGYANYYIGTVEASPSLEDVLALVEEGAYSKVVLEPLMVVSGDHANNDMAGDEEGTWKNTFEEAGYEVTCLLRGLGENEEIRGIYEDHVQAALDSAGL